jgi:hypothetical protein
MLYFSSLSVPLKIVPRATLGTRAVGCRCLGYMVDMSLLFQHREGNYLLGESRQ